MGKTSGAETASVNRATFFVPEGEKEFDPVLNAAKPKVFPDTLSSAPPQSDSSKPMPAARPNRQKKEKGAAQMQTEQIKAIVTETIEGRLKNIESAAQEVNERLNMLQRGDEENRAISAKLEKAVAEASKDSGMNLVHLISEEGNAAVKSIQEKHEAVKKNQEIREQALNRRLDESEENLKKAQETLEAAKELQKESAPASVESIIELEGRVTQLEARLKAALEKSTSAEELPRITQELSEKADKTAEKIEQLQSRIEELLVNQGNLERHVETLQREIRVLSDSPSHPVHLPPPQPTSSHDRLMEAVDNSNFFLQFLFWSSTILLLGIPYFIGLCCVSGVQKGEHPN